ncbi:MAG TPA: nuclear transport factor 2 family protein [Gemmatimonadaceae bacterium]|nr:nuclear transport factor 2 family protein [Gemmatimonadaceae bacterium]
MMKPAARIMTLGVALAAALLTLNLSADARADQSGDGQRAARALTDSSDVAAVVTRHHAALASGDSAAALALLTDDAVILESGGIETRAEYRSHHLQADVAFARAVKTERSPIRVVVRGDVAWASSTSVAQGEFRGRAINSVGAELMVLVRDSGGWKISAIHWSSRNRRG